jgi:hypothetical protein
MGDETGVYAEQEQFVANDVKPRVFVIDLNKGDVWCERDSVTMVVRSSAGIQHVRAMQWGAVCQIP